MHLSDEDAPLVIERWRANAMAMGLHAALPDVRYPLRPPTNNPLLLLLTHKMRRIAFEMLLRQKFVDVESISVLKAC